MGAMSEIPRVCATCRHFLYETGSEPVGEQTFDYVTMRCVKNRWSLEPAEADAAEFRSTMVAAVDCSDYEEILVRPLPLKPPPQTVARLAACYPAFEIGVGDTFPFKAWYDKDGAGRTTSPSFHDHAAAVEWLAVRLAEMAREA